MLPALRRLFETFILTGDVVIIGSDGRGLRFGNGEAPAVTVELADRKTEWALVLDPQLALGESYMNGQLRIRRGSLYDFLSVLQQGVMERPMPSWLRQLDRLRMSMRRLQQLNPMGRAQRNVSHHYDIEPEIYQRFLDGDQQYSCAYFMPGDDLDRAQRRKMRRLAAKLAIEPGNSVLDIGSGWGGLGAYLADYCGAHVTGVTLSEAQIRQARELAKARGLDQRLTFEIKDYRSLTESYDRVVSVGMLEHVGIDHYRRYFRKVRDVLNDDGVALIHTIGRSDGPGYTNPFIAKYIFPGGYFPALSEMMPAIEASGLMLADVEVLRLHYAETLKAWRENFLAHADWMRERKGAEFCRMWEFYLAASEGAFRYQGLVVFQLQLVAQVDALPTARGYIAEREAFLAQRDGGEDARGRFRLAGE